MPDDKTPYAALVAKSLETLDRHDAEQGEEPLGGPSRVGAVYVFPATRDFDVEWAVLAHDPSESGRVLVAPADGNPAVGGADFQLEEASALGPLVVRCLHGVWTETRFLEPDLNVGQIAPKDLRKIRRRWLELGDGRVSTDVLAHDLDDDPSYRDWIEHVAAARRALLEAQTAESLSEDTDRFVTSMAEDGSAGSEIDDAEASQSHNRYRVPSRVAAVFMVTLAGFYLWQLHDRLQDLEIAYGTAEERYGAKVGALESERDRLLDERGQLRARQGELEKAGADYRQEAEALRDRVADLDRRLSDAERHSDFVNPAIALFSAPDSGGTRGSRESVEIGDDQRTLLVFLAYAPSEAAARYQLKVKAEGSDKVLWENDQLRLQSPGEFRIILPTRMLRPGTYDLELCAMQDSECESVAVYELVVGRQAKP